MIISQKTRASKPRIRRRKPAASWMAYDALTWAPTDPDGGHQSFPSPLPTDRDVLLPEPAIEPSDADEAEAAVLLAEIDAAEIDAMFDEVFPDTTEDDRRESEYIRSQENAPADTLDAWLEDGCPDPEVYHHLEERHGFHHALGILSTLA